MRSKLIIFYFVLYPTLLLAQEKLNSVNTHTSAASSILGLQPNGVLSHKSNQALEVAFFSSSSNSSKTDFPNDFALEFTPYWTQKQSLSLDEYLFPKNVLNQIIRSSSFSVASTRSFMLGDSTSTNGLAIGYRTTFYLGNKTDREKIQSYKANSDKTKRIFNIISIKADELGDDPSILNRADFLGEIKDTIIVAFRMYESENEATRIANKILIDSDTLPQYDPQKPDDFIDRFYVVVNENLKGEELLNVYKENIKKRNGLSIDVAFATLLNFPTNEFDYSFAPKQSFWITPTYRFKGKLNFLKLMLVYRYECYKLGYYKKFYPNNTIYKHASDYGFAISTEFNKFSLQFELVNRYSNAQIPTGTGTYMKENKTDTQFIGTFNYNLTEQIVLSYSFGNGFDPILNPDNTLVSTLSINLGFGAPDKNTIK